jgi:hypothetical protein
MDLYRGIREFGKKASLVVGLVAVLSGCDSRTTEYKTSQIFKDLNGDGKPEHTYMVNTREDKDGNRWYDFDLVMKYGSGEGSFGEPRSIHRFPIKPEEVKFEDVTGDGVPDLVYLLNTREDKDGNRWYDFDLVMRTNDGNGNFGEPKLVQKFDKKPSGLY